MSTYKKIEFSKASIHQDDWKQVLLKPLPERKVYSKNDVLSITQVACRIMGTTYDETDYFLNLYDLYTTEGIDILSESLDKTIPPDRFQSIQKILMINQEEKGLSVNRFVAFLDGERLLPVSKNYVMQKHIRTTFMTVLEQFKSNHSRGFEDPDFRRVLVDLIKWSWNHLDLWLKELDIEHQMPRVVWYGEANKSQLYFLNFLLLIGCDVIIFHPEGKDEFASMDPNSERTTVIEYPSTASMQPFPTEKPERQSTVAYRASKEMDTVLHHEGSHLYKPWQFRHHIPRSVTLKTTYDELFLLAKEPAFIRPNFKATNKVVEIPTLFAKIMGISKNKKEYWDRLQKLVEYKNTELVRHFPMTEEINANYTFHYQHALNQEGKLDPEKMQKANWWQYNHLPSGTQQAIACTISSVCDHPKLLPQNKEKQEEVKLYIFTQVSNISAQFLNLMQVFDYSQEVPKLILYNTEMNGKLSRSDAVLIQFLNEFGIDIILYNPPGHNCIEQFIDSSSFDTHWLEEMSFQQEFKEPTLIGKLFRTFKL